MDITVQKNCKYDREKLTQDIRQIEEQKLPLRETEYQTKN